jgi:lipopolysaccharide export LptBFGC system permease protein LptF
LAPDPDDIVWNNMGMTHREHIVRSIMITGVIIAGLLFWIGKWSVAAVFRIVHQAENQRS